MPAPIIEATHRGQLFRRLGTFWTSLFKEPNKIRILLAVTRATKSIQKLEAVINNLAGYYQQARLVANVTLPFKDSDIIETGMMYYGDSDQAFDYAEGENVFGSFRVRYFALSLTSVLPTAIQSATGRLILGSDFFVQANEYLLFRQDPRTLFPNRKIVVLSGIERTFQALANYYLKAEIQDGHEFVIAYKRQFQTPEYYRLALAAVAGLKITHFEQKLLEVRTNVRETVYVFENETLRVDYFHSPLTVGTTYPKHYVIGEGVKLYQADSTKTNSWWRQVDWSGGLCLDPLIPFKGLHLVDQDSFVYSAGSDAGSIAGSKLHARVCLGGDPVVEEAYWQEVARKETAQGRYLNTTVNLPEDTAVTDSTLMETYAQTIANYADANLVNIQLGRPIEYPDFRAVKNQKIANPLDVFFSAGLGNRALVVVIDQSQIKNTEAAFRFAVEEVPIGCAPIIFSRIGNLPVESIDLTRNIVPNESVDLQNTIPLDLTEQVDLTSLVNDYATITAEVPI